jgi:hypothetical protein
MACVVMARAPVARWQATSCWILLAAYGILLYSDTGEFNRLEDAVAAKVSGFKPGQCVIIAAGVPDTRHSAGSHGGPCLHWALFQLLQLQTVHVRLPFESYRQESCGNT